MLYYHRKVGTAAETPCDGLPAANKLSPPPDSRRQGIFGFHVFFDVFFHLGKS